MPELLNYDILEMLGQSDFPIFLKSDVDMQKLLKKTYQDVLRELSHYEDDRHAVSAANIATINRNEFRAAITLHKGIAPAVHQVHVEVRINRRNTH